MLEKLTGPFEDHELEVSKQKDYTSVGVKQQALIARLNEVLGAAWGVTYSEPKFVAGHTVYMHVTVHIGTLKRQATGAFVVEGGRLDLAIKSAETNGFIRACALFGMAPTISQQTALAGVPKGGDPRAEAMAELERIAFNGNKVAETTEEREQEQDHAVGTSIVYEAPKPEEVAETTTEEQPKERQQSTKVDYQPSLAELTAAEAFENKIGSELVTAGMKEWDVRFADVLFQGDYNGADVRTIMLGLKFQGFKEYLDGIGRFTTKAGLRFYNDFFEKADHWVNRQLADYAKEKEIAANIKDEISEEEEQEFERHEQEASPEPQAEQQAPAKTEEAVATPKKEEAASLGEEKVIVWDGRLAESRDSSEAGMQRMFDVIEELETAGFNEDEWTEQVPAGCSIVYPTMIDFANYATDSHIQALIEDKA